MIELETLAKSINSEIKAWSKDDARLVICLDGYAGSGKTTIADLIPKQNPEILVIHLDDFIRPAAERKKLMEEAEDRSKIFEFEWYRYDVLEKLITAFKHGNDAEYEEQIYSFETHAFVPRKFDFSKKVLLIEGIFLFHPRHSISKMFDKKIYIDADFEKADERRIAREMEKWGKDYVPETHPDNWTQHFKIAYRRYIEECYPERIADFIARNR